MKYYDRTNAHHVPVARSIFQSASNYGRWAIDFFDGDRVRNRSLFCMGNISILTETSIPKAGVVLRFGIRSGLNSRTWPRFNARMTPIRANIVRPPERRATRIRGGPVRKAA